MLQYADGTNFSSISVSAGQRRLSVCTDLLSVCHERRYCDLTTGKKFTVVKLQ